MDPINDIQVKAPVIETIGAIRTGTKAAVITCVTYAAVMCRESREARHCARVA